MELQNKRFEDVLEEIRISHVNVYTGQAGEGG